MKKDSKKSIFKIFLESMEDYILRNYKILILITITLIAAITISFFKVATTNGITFNINDYEVGQISDITVRASQDYPPDYMNQTSIEKNEKVIRKGFPITEEGYQKLKKMAESSFSVDYRRFINSIIYHILLCVLFFFFINKIYYRKRLEFRELMSECTFYIVIYLMTVGASGTTMFSSPFTVCILIPSSLFVFLVSILFGQINGVFFSVIISLSVLEAASFNLVPFLYVLSTSFAATRTVRKIDRRSDMIYVSILQAMLNIVFLMTFKIIFNSSFSDGPLAISGVALNGFFSGILCLGMLTPMEIILNTASPFRLMELSDLNAPTMKKMLMTCSGTYNHSLMVANLAEAACFEIKANALLARVGAYYHDIGKMSNPEYFVENQGGGENIHSGINPSLSVSVIRSHVKRGIDKARELRLPSQVIDIIAEHHGNQVISYFYSEAKKIDENASPEDFSYTGNPPSTKESAVVMLADTVEAACRTLEKPSFSRLDKFIRTLINGKLEAGQLSDCALTFSDLTKIHDSFVQTLAGFYHSRTKYPDQKDPDTNENVNNTEAKSKENAENGK